MGIFSSCAWCGTADDCMYVHGYLICDECERMIDEDPEDDFYEDEEETNDR